MKLRIVCAIPLALMVTACDRKAEGQTIAVVNDEEVTAAELNAELNAINLPPSASKEEARSRILQSLIDRRLLAQAARKEGLDKSPEYLNQQRRLTDNLLINMLLSRRLNTAEVPRADEAVKFEATHPELFAAREIWTLEQLQFATPKDAATNAKIAASLDLAQLAQALTASGIAFTRSTNKVDTATLPHDAYAKIVGLKKGQPFVVPGGERSVASVITTREPSPVAGDQARAVALNAMRREQAANILKDRVKALRASAKIEYQAGMAPKK